MMSEQWPLKSLGELFEFTNGATFRKADWKETGLPIIRIQNLNNPDASFNYYQGEYKEKILIRNGDLLFSWSGTVGTSFGPHVWAGENGLLNQHIFKVEHGTEINRKYAYYALLEITAEIERSVVGSVGLVHVRKKDLVNFTIPVPTLEEQKRIVSILDEVFANIKQRNIQVQEKLEFSRNIYSSQIKEIFSEVDETWVKIKLGELSIVKSGGTPLRSIKDYWGGSIPWYSSGELNDIFTVEPNRYITNSGLENSNAKKFPKGSLLIGMYDTAALKMSILDREGTFNQAIAGVKPNSNIDMIFLLHAINNVKHEVRAQRRGTRQKNLSLTKIKNIELSIPSLMKQQKIADDLNIILESVCELESILTNQQEATAELRQSILQEAFSGKLTGGTTA
jgi:type I restriction enzyme, S subunit